MRRSLLESECVGDDSLILQPSGVKVDTAANWSDTDTEPDAAAALWADSVIDAVKVDTKDSWML